MAAMRARPPSASAKQSGIAVRAARSLDPRLGGKLARVRRSETSLARSAPASMVIAVAAEPGDPGASALAAIIATGLEALGPGRVAVLDADGARQAQRTLLGSGSGGGIRQLLASPQALKIRRTVDSYLARDGSVPMLAAAAAERGEPLSGPEIAQALRVLQRRFPIVVVDASALAGDVAALDWLVSSASKALVLAPRTPGTVFHAWLSGQRARPVGAQCEVTVVRRADLPETVRSDVSVPPELLTSRERVSFAALEFESLAAVEEILALMITPPLRA